MTGSTSSNPYNISRDTDTPLANSGNALTYPTAALPTAISTKMLDPLKSFAEEKSKAAMALIPTGADATPPTTVDSASHSHEDFIQSSIITLADAYAQYLVAKQDDERMRNHAIDAADYLKNELRQRQVPEEKAVAFVKEVCAKIKEQFFKAANALPVYSGPKHGAAAVTAAANATNNQTATVTAA